MQKFGQLPKTTVIRHKCDNRLCINILHLEPGTLADNCRDRHGRGRTRGGSLPGSKNPGSKLTEAQVLFIRKHHEKYSQNELAKKFGVCQTRISHIVLRKEWRHI
jgi:hypothetical protein